MQYGDYTIVRYTPEFRDSLLDLLSLLWGDDKSNNSAYFKWKYDQNPYADRHWIYMALYDGKPVAVLGNLPMRWQVGNPVNCISCMCNVDGVVKPEYRRRGLFEALSIFNLQDLEKTSFHYFVTLSANTQSAAGILKLGWQTVGPIQPFVRMKPPPVNAESKVKILARKVPLARKAYTAVRRVVGSPPPSPSKEAEIKKPYEFLDKQKRRLEEMYPHLSLEDAARPAEMADLVARLTAGPRMRHVRDSEYFTWRYLNPRSCYRFLFWEEQTLEGYLILQTPARPGTHAVSIVDWEAFDPAVRVKLLQAAIEMGDFETLKTWGISLSEQSIEMLLQEGFLPENGDLDQENYQPQVLLRPAALQPQEADWQVANMDLLDLHNWDIRPVYSDTF